MAVKGCYAVSVVLVLTVCGVRLIFRQYHGQQDCEMTYMYQWPQYLEMPLPKGVGHRYPQYSLHYYHESGLKLKSLPLPLYGIPVLFLPGNAGSYKQARSSASIALRMHASDFQQKRHFDFFTINFNEELSGMFGGVLSAQTKFLDICIQHILSLYEGVKPRPLSVIIIGHSMGGLIAQALFTDPQFNPSTVNTIITLSSPLLRPVLSFDPLIQNFYEAIREVWSDQNGNTSHVMLVSVSGGERDVMVPTHLTFVPTALSVAAAAVPRNWASADHLAIVWCRRLQLALTRGLFLLQENGRRDLSRNTSHRYRQFHHLLNKGKEIPLPDNSFHHLNLKDVLFANSSEYYQDGFQQGVKYVALPLPSNNTSLLVASNIGASRWLYVCAIPQPVSTGKCNCKDASSLASLLPPKQAVVKYVLLKQVELVLQLPGVVHLVLFRPRPDRMVKRFVLVQRWNSSSSITLPLPWLKTKLRIPSGHSSLINISLSHLNQIWQSYEVEVTSQCGGVSGGLVIPWYPHPPLSNSTQSSLLLKLSLLVPPPAETPPPYLLLWSASECELEVVVTLDLLTLLDKLAVIYAPLLLPWVTSMSVSAASRWIKLELLLLTVLYEATSNGLFSGLSDWVEMGPLWSWWSPLILHLISHGLFQLLYFLVSLVASIFQAFLGSRMRQIVSLVLLLTSLPLLVLCSSISLFLALTGFMLQAKGGRSLRITCVVVCLGLLTLPSLFSWVRGLRFSSSLSTDPHLMSVMASISLLSVILYTESQRKDSSGGVCGNELSPPLSVSIMESGLGVAVLCLCLVHTYRIVSYVLLYLLLTAVTNIYHNLC